MRAGIVLETWKHIVLPVPPFCRYGAWATKDWVATKVRETYGMNNHVHFPNENLLAGRQGPLTQTTQTVHPDAVSKPCDLKGDYGPLVIQKSRSLGSKDSGRINISDPNILEPCLAHHERPVEPVPNEAIYVPWWQSLWSLQEPTWTQKSE